MPIEGSYSLININSVDNLYKAIQQELSKVVIGKAQIKESLMIALIAGGHVLIEGPPGSAKTKLAGSFARSIGGVFKRVQLTADMMPADITGFNYYSTSGTSTFVPGPIFANVVLADELNRTTPRTQAALLEAMQECQVTIERKTYALEKPFMVVATQVQSGSEGTYSLTNVQIDRFLLHIWSDYPTVQEEQEIINNIDRIDQSDIKQIITLEELRSIQLSAKEVHIAPAISEYIVSLITGVRSDPDVLSGPSPRASIALYKCARVFALLNGRDFVIPDDVKHLMYEVVEHRIQIKSEAEMDEVTIRMVLDRALEKTPVPKL
jgi:MoxR-like ATPase